MLQIQGSWPRVQGTGPRCQGSAPRVQGPGPYLQVAIRACVKGHKGSLHNVECAANLGELEGAVVTLVEEVDDGEHLGGGCF